MSHRGCVLPTLILAILTAATLAVAAAFPTPARAEKRVALVIGNDRYPNLPAGQQLLKAANDAEAVGDGLAKLGYTVIRGQNLGRQGIFEKLSAFTAQLEPGDTAAFFYAGHGIAIGGVNYLVPSDVPAVGPDAETRVRGNAIAEGDIIEEIRAKGARFTLVVLDACRDNPFPRSGTRTIGNTRGLAETITLKGVFKIYSAGIGQTALDRLEKNDPDPNSVFTRVFVQKLARTDLHLADLIFEVREKVAELALTAKDEGGRPEPHAQTPAYYDETIGGRFYLAGPPIGMQPGKPAGATPKSDDFSALQDRLKRLEEQFAPRPAPRDPEKERPAVPISPSPTANCGGYGAAQVIEPITLLYKATNSKDIDLYGQQLADDLVYRNQRSGKTFNKLDKIKSKRDGFRNLKTLNLTMDKFPDITINKATNRADVRVTYSMTYTTNNQITLTQNGIVETYAVSCSPNGKWLVIENIDEISAAGPPHPG